MHTTSPSSKFRTNLAARTPLRPANMKASKIIRTRRSPEMRTNTMLQSRKNASLNQMRPRRKISVLTISLRRIIRRAAPAGPARISAVEMIAAMTEETIADRIPAAVAVAVSAGAGDVAAEAVLGQAAAICRPRNMLHRKARTILAEIHVATSRVRKAKTAALNLADSNHAVQRSAASIIAAPKHRARAALLQ